MGYLCFFAATPQVAWYWLPAAAAIGMLVVLLPWLIYRFMTQRKRRLDQHQVSHLTRRFIQDRERNEALLGDIDIGIVIYDQTGRRILINKKAIELLDDKKPETPDEFYACFADLSSLRAILALGGDTAAQIVEKNDRTLEISARVSRPEGQQLATIFTLQDRTDQTREELQRKIFVANVSHELKTPLTTIKTYSESLLDWGLAEKQPASIRRDVRRIHEDALRMEKLVADLSLLTSIDSRGLQPHMEEQDIAGIVRQTVERSQPSAAAKQITLSCPDTGPVPNVFVEKSSIEQIVSNLVMNAIKYTQKGGNVLVSVNGLVDEVYVKVADNGPGIEPRHLPQIFNRFFRVDMTGSQVFGGTGLGLAIADELAQLHEGRIEVSSTLGLGSTFTLFLPTARKVYRRAIDDASHSIEHKSPLQTEVQRVLLEQSRELGYTVTGLPELTAEQREALLRTYNE